MLLSMTSSFGIEKMQQMMTSSLLHLASILLLPFKSNGLGATNVGYLDSIVLKLHWIY
jgi:hypothetical protein